MNIDVIISADYVREDIIKDKIVVVIDMLRATSVITTAFMNSCSCVIPCLTVEDAFKLKSEKSLLGGERRAVKIEGFDLSNSPLEYTEEVVGSKDVILTTTNGTRTLLSCKEADRIFIGCMLNAAAVAEKLCSINKDVVIVNAGTNGQFSKDDFICTGFIISEMMKINKSLVCSDIAKTALDIYKNYPDILSYIRDARHYNVMLGLGLQDDINYCIQKNVTSVVPEFLNNHIIRIN